MRILISPAQVGSVTCGYSRSHADLIPLLDSCVTLGKSLTFLGLSLHFDHVGVARGAVRIDTLWCLQASLRAPVAVTCQMRLENVWVPQLLPRVLWGSPGWKVLASACFLRSLTFSGLPNTS